MVITRGLIIRFDIKTKKLSLSLLNLSVFFVGFVADQIENVMKMLFLSGNKDEN